MRAVTFAYWVLPWASLAVAGCGPDESKSATVSPDDATAPAVVESSPGEEEAEGAEETAGLAPGEDFPMIGNGCRKGSAEGGELVLVHPEEGYTLVLGDVDWNIDCSPETPGVIFRGQFQSITMQLAKIPSSEFGSLDEALQAFSMGGREAMQRDMALPADVEFEKRELGEEGMPGLCWGGLVEAEGKKVQLYTCATAKPVPKTDTIIVGQSMMFASPEEWKREQATLMQAGESLASSFFLTQELLEDE